MAGARWCDGRDGDCEEMVMVMVMVMAVVTVAVTVVPRVLEGRGPM